MFYVYPEESGGIHSGHRMNVGGVRMTQQGIASNCVPKPQISRFAFAMFDVLGFSSWLKSAGLQAVLDSYHLLIERAVIKPDEKGSLNPGRCRQEYSFSLVPKKPRSDLPMCDIFLGNRSQLHG